jgi:hypothetical protein
MTGVGKGKVDEKKAFEAILADNFRDPASLGVSYCGLWRRRYSGPITVDREVVVTATPPAPKRPAS